MNRFPLAAVPAFLIAAGLALPASAQLLTPAAPAPTASPLANATLQPLDRIVAVVNDGVILQSQLNETMGNVSHQITTSGGKLPPQDVLEKQVLQRLILNELQMQKAHDSGVRVSDDQVDAAITNIAQQNKMTVAQMQAAMQQEGVDYASFRQQVRDQLLVHAMQQQVMQSSAQISDAEIDNLIASPAFRQGEVQLGRILVALPEGANAGQIAAAQAKADKIDAELKAGKDFKTLAISNSNAPEALDGGDLGWRRVDELPPPLQQIIAGLQPGGVTEPLRDASGFTILKLEGRRTPDEKHIVTEYHALHLMIKPTAVLNDAAAKARIEQLYHEAVANPADFGKLAKENSDDPTTANAGGGGDMGWFMQNDWGSDVGKLLATMQPDQISQPFQSADGSWHIIELLGTRQADKTRDIEREQARQAIAARKGQQAYEQFLRDIESSAYIHILIPGFSDAAVTAGATGP